MALEISRKNRTLKVTQVQKAAFRVFVVDRDAMSSQLLSGALVRDLRCDAAAISPLDLLRLLAVHDTNLVVIGADLSWKSGSGLDLAIAVHQAHPKTKIVILLRETTKESVVAAFRSGASGAIGRQEKILDFVDCIERVSRGFLWAGKEETSYLLEAFRNIPAPKAYISGSPLTARELQVVQCAAKGKSNKCIANELSLSEHTVKNYLFKVFDKLGVSSRVELLFYLTMKGHTLGTSDADWMDETSGVECRAES